MAANSTTIDKDIPIGETEHLYLVTIVPSTSYPAGGEVLDASGNTRFERINCSAPGYVTEFIPSSQKLKIYRQKDPANAGGADIALPEVAATTDLSAVTFYGIAVGS